MKHPAHAMLILIMFFFTACKVDLYSNLQETEANEMLAICLSNGIKAEKSRGDEGWLLQVEESHLAQAVTVLKNAGYPRQEFQSMGAVFKKEGLISSPTEERIRFLYALSQELANTISRIDGVLDARVHIVLPESDPLTDLVLQASASVFVRYREGSTIEAHVPKIKELVVNGVGGLEVENVGVALFPSVPLPTQPEPASAMSPAAIAALVLVILLILAGAGYAFYQNRHKFQTKKLISTGEVGHAATAT